MAECNTCGGYLSIEDKIRLSMKCDANGNVVWNGALLNQNEPEVTAYIAGLTTPLSSGQIEKLNTFVAAIKNGLGISALSDAFDVMYILGGETAESSLKNIVKNAHHATAVNSPAFTQFEGFTGNKTSAYINTYYKPNDDKVNFSLNSASIGIYNRTELSDSIEAELGASTTNPKLYVQMNITGSKLFASRINEDTGGTQPSTSSSKRGMAVFTRKSNTEVDGYMNKILVGTRISTSTSITNNYVNILRVTDNVTLYSTSQLSFVFIGRNITQPEVNIITDAIEAYMDSNGKGVIA